MKFTKKRNYSGTIRKVWNDDKTECYGLVGTVDELLKEGILDYCNAPINAWAFLPFDGMKYVARFADTRDGVVFGLD